MLKKVFDKLELDEEEDTMGKKKKHKKSSWTPPKDYKDYFYASSEDEFKAKHPIGYVFLVMLGITVLLLPALLFSIFVSNSTALYSINKKESVKNIKLAGNNFSKNSFV